MIAKSGTIFCSMVALSMSILEASEHTDPFSCFADICNVNAEAQFCDVVARKCRQCSDVRDDCFTRLQTINCTQFCYDARFNSDREKIRVAGCDVPSTPKNGHYKVNSTRVAYNANMDVTCDIGYALVQTEALKCSNYSMWSGSIPKCEGSLNTFLTLTLVMGVFLTVSVSGNIFMFIKIKRCKGKTQNNHGVNKNVEGNPSIETNSSTEILSPLENGNTERKIPDQLNEHDDSINDVCESLIPVHNSSSRLESNSPYQSKKNTQARSDSPIVTQPELGDTGEDVKIAYNHGAFHPLDIELNKRLY
ncbi:uncharacterized protein LOC127863227 [Dreissena polymorpha]|uniref:Sushi domain-containing protein n=1 Tax=Dreissena polymorpha TaxID=45954 RepID=A0A9D4BFF6_DREPO|nr:uncharacterized protein LOC127863227 [Dreissena polymorpha]KAH3692770.1 hypothetical protein DPMN_194522 [Dreissena polymorpha]